MFDTYHLHVHVLLKARHFTLPIVLVKFPIVLLKYCTDFTLKLSGMIVKQQHDKQTTKVLMDPQPLGPKEIDGLLVPPGKASTLSTD